MAHGPDVQAKAVVTGAALLCFYMCITKGASYGQDVRNAYSQLPMLHMLVCLQVAWSPT